MIQTLIMCERLSGCGGGWIFSVYESNDAVVGAD